MSRFLGRRVLSPEVRRFMREWVAPPGYYTRLSMKVFNSFSRLRFQEAALLSRNARFKNLYAGRRCFVIGNGPSLNNQDLVPLANELTIVMNSFNKNPIIDKWKPTFFCMAEPGSTLSNMDLSEFVDRIDAEAYFFTIETKRCFDEHSYADPQRVYYLAMRDPIDNGPRRHAPDLTRTVPGVWSTPQMAIMIALYMGCSPIYLLGLDHDFLAKPNGILGHFYGESTELREWSYKALMEMTLILWRTHEYLRDVASKEGKTIYNATRGGFLDVYPRVEFESLFPSKDA